MKLDGLPRLLLARYPTPLEDAPRLAEALGVARLLVKRDDLTDLALGGNKVRKLEYLLGEALAQRADTIITTASAQSNFLRLTAAACRRMGLRPILVVRGRSDAPVRGNLLLMRLFGADVHYVDTDDPYAASTVALMHGLADEVRARGGRPYLIHLGTFSGGRAALGYVQAAFELHEQLADRQTRCDHVVLADGSGTMHAGLLLGLRLAGAGSHVMGVSVNTPAIELRARIAGHMQAAADLVGVPSPVSDVEIDVTDAYVGPGYGIPTPESLEAVRLAAAREGLLFDPVYTGKAWAAASDAVRTGRIRREAVVVFLHSGGAPNLFLHADALAGVAAGHGAVTR
ncbi:MAG: D-cysteine desulfhydrase family protein [Armatimonadota bacterium]|nr:D-cysteine desulfhydrase family protein [Armatimonadota bacterium]